jgi:hypothetical protein
MAWKKSANAIGLFPSACIFRPKTALQRLDQSKAWGLFLLVALLSAAKRVPEPEYQIFSQKPTCRITAMEQAQTACKAAKLGAVIRYCLMSHDMLCGLNRKKAAKYAVAKKSFEFLELGL